MEKRDAPARLLISTVFLSGGVNSGGEAGMEKRSPCYNGSSPGYYSTGLRVTTLGVTPHVGSSDC
jgi:hypothetical protein